MLDRLFTVKTLPNRVYLQLKVYDYRMIDTKTIDESIDDFLKLINDLSNLIIEVPEEVQAVLVLRSLPAKFDLLRETLKYSRDIIKVEEVVSAAKSKELELRENGGSKVTAEGLFVRGRSDSKNNHYGNKGNISRSKSKEGKKFCWICGKEGHYKK